MDFNQWMKKVDQFLAASLIGLTSSDLPDIAYYELWEDGCEPQDAAIEALAEAGAYELWDGDLLDALLDF